jgi:hypothetical protein
MNTNENYIIDQDEPPRKNVKIKESVHIILKEYCDSRDLKIQRFIERLIINNCVEDNKENK